MSFPTDWDLDNYKTDYESDEHWELRKTFMEAHKESFPENELVCLAQVFTNIELLGCRYPAGTMTKVALLSKEVAANFRQSRESRLKRTFVTASDAANAKAKGRRSQTKTSLDQSSSSLSHSFVAESSNAANNSTNEDIPSPSVDNNIVNFKKPKIAIEVKRESDEDDSLLCRPSFAMSGPATVPVKNGSSPIQQLEMDEIPDTGLILYEPLSDQNSASILQQSTAKKGLKLEFEYQDDGQCMVKINGEIYGRSGTADNRKDSKLKAADAALQYAREIHYTIKQKAVNVKNVNQLNSSSTQPASTSSAPALELTESNKGFQMMKMLGWTGGSLGLKGNGIEQPITVEVKVNRSGLGLSSTDKGHSLNSIRNAFFGYLSKYLRDPLATHDLVFAKEFSKEERKTLHELASQLGLRSKSHNDPEDKSRYLVISKKLSLIALANEIMNNGLRAQCYELIPPTNPRPLQSNSGISKPQHSQPTRTNGNKEPGILKKAIKKGKADKMSLQRPQAKQQLQQEYKQRKAWISNIPQQQQQSGPHQQRPQLRQQSRSQAHQPYQQGSQQQKQQQSRQQQSHGARI